MKRPLTRMDAIRLLDRITEKDDPYWESLVDDWYHEPSDSMPTIWDLARALGVSSEEWRTATGTEFPHDDPWPSAPQEGAP